MISFFAEGVFLMIVGVALIAQFAVSVYYFMRSGEVVDYSELSPDLYRRLFISPNKRSYFNEGTEKKKRTEI